MLGAHSGLARLARAVLSASVAAAVLLPVLPAQAEVMLAVDRAKVLRVNRPADVVIIGNPAIADATVRDSQTLIITGHSFGSTNLIVLDVEVDGPAGEAEAIGQFPRLAGHYEVAERVDGPRVITGAPVRPRLLLVPKP